MSCELLLLYNGGWGIANKIHVYIVTIKLYQILLIIISIYYFYLCVLSVLLTLIKYLLFHCRYRSYVIMSARIDVLFNKYFLKSLYRILFIEN